MNADEILAGQHFQSELAFRLSKPWRTSSEQIKGRNQIRDQFGTGFKSNLKLTVCQHSKHEFSDRALFKSFCPWS
jgi:hypothetical protein